LENLKTIAGHGWIQYFHNTTPDSRLAKQDSRRVLFPGLPGPLNVPAARPGCGHSSCALFGSAGESPAIGVVFTQWSFSGP